MLEYLLFWKGWKVFRRNHSWDEITLVVFFATPLRGNVVFDDRVCLYCNIVLMNISRNVAFTRTPL